MKDMKGVLNMEYNFQQHVTKEDYVSFFMNHLKMNILKPANVVLFVIGFGYLAAAPFINGTGDYLFTYIGFGLFVFMLVSVFYARFSAGKRYDKNEGMFDMSYQVTDEAFTFMVGGQPVEKKWIDFYSATETTDYLYLFVSRDNGTVLVKRDVPQDAIDFIRRQLVAHVNPKRVKLLKNQD